MSKTGVPKELMTWDVSMELMTDMSKTEVPKERVFGMGF